MCNNFNSLSRENSINVLHQWITWVCVMKGSWFYSIEGHWSLHIYFLRYFCRILLFGQYYTTVFPQLVKFSVGLTSVPCKYVQIPFLFHYSHMISICVFCHMKKYLQLYKPHRSYDIQWILLKSNLSLLILTTDYFRR